eukprot:m.207333 g.207333  ORF g.207333 m.207333 type:complete len:864 (+) comp32981_c0_seq2:108-2699(+)
MIQDSNTGVQVQLSSRQLTTERAMDIESKMRERKLQASLLSIKMFWAPELEKERRSRITERKRADKAETVLKMQLEKGLQYMQKLIEMESAYSSLERNADKQTRLETELRAQLEDQLNRQTQARLNKYNNNDTVIMEEKLHRQDYELQKLHKKLLEKQDNIAALNARLNNANKKLDEADVVAAKVSKLERDLQASKQVIKENQALKIRQMQLEQTSSKAQAAKAEHEQLGQMIDTMKEELAKSAQMNTKAEQHIQSLVAEAGAQEKDIVRLQTEKKTMMEEKSQLEQKLNEAQLESVSSEQAKFKASIETERLNNKLSGMQLDLKTKTEELESSKQNSINSEKMIEMLRASVTANEKRSEQLAKQLQGKSSQLESIRAELVLEKDNYQKALSSARENEDAKSGMEQLSLKIKHFESELSDKNDEMARLHAELHIKRQEVIVVQDSSITEVDHSKMEALENRIQTLEGDITAKTTELRTAQEKTEELTSKINDVTKDLEAKIKAAEALATKNKTRATTLSRKNLALQAEVAALKKVHREVEAKENMLKKQLDSTTTQLGLQQKRTQNEQESREQMTQQHQTRLDALVQETEQVRNELTEQTKENLALAQKCTSIESRVSDAEGENASLVADAQKATLELNALQAKLQEQETSCVEHSASLDKITEELVDTKSRVRDLQRTIRDVEERHITEVTNNILVLVSDLDKQISKLEEEGAQKNKQWISDLLQKRKLHVDELKVQFEKRDALVESVESNVGVTQRSDLVETLEVRRTESKGMRNYIDQLLEQVRSEDETTVQRIMVELPTLPECDNVDAESLDDAAIKDRILTESDTLFTLEQYVDQLLNQILQHCPSLLESGSLQISSP